MTRRSWMVGCGVAAAVAAISGDAAAQGIDLSSGGPVQVTAQGGFEWREAEQMVIASGDARAQRGSVTVLADRLLARYRKRAGAATAAAAPAPAASPADSAGGIGGADSGDNEVYRLEAEGHVRIVTPTDEAVADRAIYDIDQAVLVLTGGDLRLTTPQQVLTARDSLEYWSQKHVAVGRGNAVVVTSDGRRLSADTLVGYTTEPPPGDAASKGAAEKGTTRTAAAPPASGASSGSADPLAAGGKLQRVEAFGNVEVRTVSDTVRGDRGVYSPDTGIARVVGHVRITHGQNQLNGPAADVNMRTGVAHIVSAPGARVEGLIMPNEAGSQPGGKPMASPAPATSRGPSGNGRPAP